MKSTTEMQNHFAVLIGDEFDMQVDSGKTPAEAITNLCTEWGLTRSQCHELIKVNARIQSNAETYDNLGDIA